jgi:hypothetical protein
MARMFDLLIHLIFTSSVVVIGIPVSVYLISKGTEGYVKYKYSKVPDGFLISNGLGKYSLQILFYGMFILSFSIWFLFIDRGGQLIVLVNNITHIVN